MVQSNITLRSEEERLYFLQKLLFSFNFLDHDKASEFQSQYNQFMVTAKNNNPNATSKELSKKFFTTKQTDLLDKISFWKDFKDNNSLKTVSWKICWQYKLCKVFHSWIFEKKEEKASSRQTWIAYWKKGWDVSQGMLGLVIFFASMTQLPYSFKLLRSFIAPEGKSVHTPIDLVEGTKETVKNWICSYQVSLIFDTLMLSCYELDLTFSLI